MTDRELIEHTAEAIYTGHCLSIERDMPLWTQDWRSGEAVREWYIAKARALLFQKRLL